MNQKTKRLLILILLINTQLFFGQESNSKFEKIKELGGIEEYTYIPNDLNLLLVQDNSSPVVTVQIVYRVGSKHEVTGNTGATHLLEHLMFKGTPTFNKRKGTSIDSKLNNIGAQMNATTWYDRTNYFETIPSDHIETAIHIEADRMRNSLLLKEDKDAEMTVVRNEFERGENNPNSLLNKEIWSTAYKAHPYHHSTIGWRSDIENMPIETLREFYNTYYWPNNATLTIIGDFQKENVFNLVDKYFGKISKAPHELPQPYTEEPVQLGPRKTIIKKQGTNGIILKGYKIPGRMHNDLPALKVLSEILGSGTLSVLNKSLVDTGEAFFTYANISNFKEVGLFMIGTGFKPTKKHEDLEKRINEIVTKIQKEGVSQEDVDRIIEKVNAKTILSRDGSGTIAGQLNEAIAGGDWTDYINRIKRLEKVTAQDVQRVAKKYLLEDQSTTGYFVPKSLGSNKGNGSNKSSNYFSKNEANGKFYYRDPAINLPITLSKLNKESKYSFEEVNNSRKYNRKKIAGIDVVSVKTATKGFVTVAASMPIENYLKIKSNNPMVPSLAVQMLNKGTLKNDKFKFSKKLEELGVDIRLSAGTYLINMSFKCLAKDINTVVGLFAEELRYPLFDKKEFELLKQQTISNAERGLNDPGTRGRIALSQEIYSKGHPNYIDDIQKTIEDIKKVSLNDLKSFHKTYFGTKGMHLVAVGDVDTKNIYAALKKYFKGWNGGERGTINLSNSKKKESFSDVITIEQKPSAELFIGQYTGLKKSDSEFLPFYIANSILGGGFSGRLMRTVRDEQGLTYSISSGHRGDVNTGGHWSVNASFNPNLFQKGFDATLFQVKKWINKGVTAEELKNKKTNITGSFKVGLSSTGGLAGTILSFVQRGLEPSYIDQYPKEIEAVTLDQVNNSIKKYIDLDKLIIIKSGSLNKDGKPLK